MDKYNRREPVEKSISHNATRLKHKLCKLYWVGMADDGLMWERIYLSICSRRQFLSNMKFLSVIVVVLCLPHTSLGADNSCYDARGRPQKCVPEFVNAAFNLTVDATNTCGLTGPQEFCLQTGVTGVRKSCGHFCDAGNEQQRHPPSFMTDFNNQNYWTWWQSETMSERRDEWLGTRIQPVNLTLHLGNAESC